MSEPCFFCRGPVNPHDKGTWKRVTGWVGGPRKDGMTLRDDTGDYAHDSCVHKARQGQAADQPELLTLPEDVQPAPPPAFIIAKFPEGERMLDTDDEKDMRDLEELLGE